MKLINQKYREIILVGTGVYTRGSMTFTFREGRE